VIRDTLQKNLRPNWTLAQDKNEYTLNRTDKVEYLPTVNLPPFLDLEEEARKSDSKYTISQPFKIRLIIKKSLSADELATIRRTNDGIRDKMKELARQIHTNKGILSPATDA
jgi:hypothetical protein